MNDLLRTNEVPMPAETIKALRGSIKKWQAIVDGTGFDGGYMNCPLCKLFNSLGVGANRCKGCPVYGKTGMTGCLGTPYIAFEEANQLVRYGEKPREYEIPFAQAELDFLISLLPEGETL